MDHLPISTDGVRPPITVPVLGDTSTGCAIYDGGDFVTFPERCGFSTRLDVNGVDQVLDIEALSQHSYLDSLRFIQAWLYFGTLHRAFSVLGLQIVESAFIRETSEGAVLDSSQLTRSLEGSESPSFITGWLAGRRMAQRKHSIELRFLWNTVIIQTQHLEVAWRHHERTDTPFGEIMLSIKVLAHTLLAFGGRSFDTTSVRKAGDSFGEMTPSTFPIYRYLLETKGWCPHQVIDICQRFSPITLYFLASMKRRTAADHTSCKQSQKCVAHNIGRNFVAKHVAPCTGQNCYPMAPTNQDRFLGIVRDGKVPVVVARNDTDSVKLHCDPTNPDVGYIAVSHVWFDGLGDPNHNHLPACQLMQLMDRLHEARKSIAGSSGWCAPLLNLPKRHQNVPDLVFWLDAYCIPALSTDEEVNRLKSNAIMRMVPTYGLAQQVLVLDSELWRLPQEASSLDLMAGLVISAWRSRYWTHQEFSLAGTDSVIVQYQKPVRLRNLLKNASMGVGPYDSPYRRSQGNAGTNGTLRQALTKHSSTELASLLLESKVGATQLQLRNRKLVRDPFRKTLWRLDDSVRRLLGLPPGSRRSEHAFFLSMWSSFLEKTSSKPEDMHGILANLLNLDTDSILQLKPELRLRTILASYGDLPMNLLMSCPRTSHLGSRGQPASAPEDRWIPMLPDDRNIPLLPLDDGLFFHVLPEGIVCSPSVSHNTLWIKRPPADVWNTEGWHVQVEIDDKCNESKQRLGIQVSLVCEEDGSRNPWHDNGMLLFLSASILANAPGSKDESGQTNLWQRGVCFRKLSIDSEHVWAQWICAARYRLFHPSALSGHTPERLCAGASLSKIPGFDTQKVGIACSTSPSTWPRITLRRRPGILNGKRSLMSILVIPYFVVIFCFIIFLFAPSFFCVLAVGFVAFYEGAYYTYRLSQWYIGLASFYSTDKTAADRFWWQKLHRTLPWRAQRGREGLSYNILLTPLAIMTLHFLMDVMRVLEPAVLWYMPAVRQRGPPSRANPAADRAMEDAIPLDRV